MLSNLLKRLQILGLVSMCSIFSQQVFAECPAGYEDMCLSTVNGHSKIKIDWIGNKAVTKNGVISVSAALCFAENGTCKGDDYSVVLNTGSESDTIPVIGSPNNKYSVCMNNCYRSKEEQPNSTEGPDWKEIGSCSEEFAVTLVD